MKRASPRELHDERPEQIALDVQQKIWREHLTTDRVPAEIGQMFGVSALNVRKILSKGLGRPNAQEEETLLSARRHAVPDPSRMYLSPGILVADLERIEDIDEGRALIRNTIAALEAEMAAEQDWQKENAEVRVQHTWWTKRRSRRSYLKAVMAALDQRNAQIKKDLREQEKKNNIEKSNSEQRLILRIIRELDRNLYLKAVKLAYDRWPDQMSGRPPDEEVE